MNRQQAIEAAGWAENLSSMERTIQNATEAKRQHIAKCKHWSTRDQQDPNHGTEAICEWCGLEVKP